MKCLLPFLAGVSLFFLVQNINAQDTAEAEQEGKKAPLRISRIEGEFGVGWQYDRTFRNSGELLARAGIELNKAYNLNAGILFNNNAYFTEYISFVNAAVSLSIVPLPFFNYFDIKVLYIYDDISDYKTRSHSFIPFISFNLKYGGIDLGPHWRWTNFQGSQTIAESMIAVSIALTPLKTENFLAGAAVANFDEYYPANFWDIYIKIFFDYHFNQYITFDNSCSLFRTGVDGWTAAFYGFKARSVIKVSW